MADNYEEVIGRFCEYINRNIIPSFRDYHPEYDKLVVTLNEALKNAAAYEPYMPVRDRYDILDATLAFIENNPGMEITEDSVRDNIETLSDTYILLQLKDDKLHDIGFESMSFLNRNRIDVKLENYDVAYSGKISSLTDSEGTVRDPDCLDIIFERFNMEIPQDFKGRSASVSDVIVLCNNHSVNAYYVDNIGCYKLDENFITRSEAVGMADKWLMDKKEMNRTSDGNSVVTDQTGKKIVNRFYKNMAEDCRNRAEKGIFRKEEMLSKAKIYDFLATCTPEDIINLYNSGAFNDITEAYARKALFFQQVDYNTVGNVIAEIKSLHDMETPISVTQWSNETDSEKKWNEGIEIFNDNSDEYEL